MGSSKNQNNLKKPRISQKVMDELAASCLISDMKQKVQLLETENKELKAQIKEWEIEREEVFQECVKLKTLLKN
jgi:predicted amino acid-binding ACT domain protein